MLPKLQKLACFSLFPSLRGVLFFVLKGNKKQAHKNGLLQFKIPVAAVAGKKGLAWPHQAAAHHKSNVKC